MIESCKVNEQQDGTWTPLHMHFMSSYLDGMLRFDQIEELKVKGIKSCAITDHGNLSGTYEFFLEAKKAGIKPLIGIENYTAFDMRAKGEDALGKARPNYHMILIAKNMNGYRNLSKINTISYHEGFYYSPRMDDGLLAEYCKDLIGTSTCLGSKTSQLILRDMIDSARDLLSYYKELFNGDFFLELQGHDDNPEQTKVNHYLLQFSKELDLPLIVTSDSHYMNHCDKSLHDKFLAIGTGALLDEEDRFTFEGLECHVPSYNELVIRCAKHGIPEEAIRNTNYIADMVDSNYFDNRMNRWPRFKKIPPEYQNSFDYIRYLCWENALVKYNSNVPPEVIQRVKDELVVLKQMDYIDYMLILWDILQYCSRNNLPYGPGRGSAAGCMVAYLLDITKVNPIEHGLLFSRFCNEGRGATPIIF